MNTPTDLPVREMARRLGLAPSMVIKLRAAGMPMHCEAAAAQWRAEHVAPRPGATKAAAVKDQGGHTTLIGTAAPAKYAPWRARREKALALQAELELQRQLGAVVAVDDVISVVAAKCTVAKDLLLGMSARLAPIVTSLSPNDARRMLDDEVHRALNELAEIMYSVRPEKGQP